MAILILVFVKIFINNPASLKLNNDWIRILLFGMDYHERRKFFHDATKNKFCPQRSWTKTEVYKKLSVSIED